ncbi:hypothetical protein AOLI_G00189290 [Acnodon oligacanthus]
MFMRAVLSLLLVQLIVERHAERAQEQLQLDPGVKGSAKRSLPDQLLFYCDDESLTVRFFQDHLSDLYLLIATLLVWPLDTDLDTLSALSAPVGAVCSEGR